TSFGAGFLIHTLFVFLGDFSAAGIEYCDDHAQPGEMFLTEQANMHRLLDSYRPATSRRHSPTRGHSREQRLCRVKQFSPPERNRPWSRAPLRTANVTRERSSANGTGHRRHFARANANVGGRTTRRKVYQNTNHPERGPGGFRWHEHHEDPYLGVSQGNALHSRGHTQAWASEPTNHAGMEEAAQQHKKHGNTDTARIRSNQEYGANQEALQHMYDWSQSVSLAVEDAKLARQRASSGPSMECESSKKSVFKEFAGRAANYDWSSPNLGAATGTTSMLPPIHVTPQPPPSERIKTSPSQYESVLQSGNAENAKDYQALDHPVNPGKALANGDGGDDGNGDGNEKEDDEDGGKGDEQDDISTKSQPSSNTSSISSLSLPNEGYILEIVRRSNRWAPAMLELPKQRTLRCETDWKDQKLKSEILRAARKAEEYYEISEQKQEQTVRLHEQTMRSHMETMQYHEKAEQQVKRTEALVIKLNDGILSQGGRM
ncbi:MAG: hypothetical protein Q9180_001750, partial [Flavoplaca navasiana]